MSCKVYYSPVKYFIAVPPAMLIKFTIGSQVLFSPRLFLPLLFFKKKKQTSKQFSKYNA